MLVLLGDFNTSLSTRSKVVGSGQFVHNGRRQAGTQHTDSSELHDLLRQHSLLALNTWMSDNTATFLHGSVASRLDYICCRQVHADQTAKEVHALPEFFMRSATGAHHVPLLVSLIRRWTPPAQQIYANSWSYRQRLELHQRWQHPDHYMLALQHDLHAQVANIPVTADPMVALHSAMNRIDAKNFNSSRTPPVHQFDLTPFQAFQHHERQLRELPIDMCNPSSLLQAWFHVCKTSTSTHTDESNSQACAESQTTKSF